jgi:hypothetical protein
LTWVHIKSGKPLKVSHNTRDSISFIQV